MKKKKIMIIIIIKIRDTIKNILVNFKTQHEAK